MLFYVRFSVRYNFRLLSISPKLHSLFRTSAAMLSARVSLGARPVTSARAAARPAPRSATLVARARGAAWSPGDTAPAHLDGRRVAV